MAANFPNTPSLNDQYVYNGITWRWNGVAWVVIGAGNISNFDGVGRDFLLLEEIDVEAGTGSNDTAAWTAACVASNATGKGILLLNKTYLIEGRTVAEGNYTFKNFLRGMGDTLIKGFTSPDRIPAGAGYTWPRILPLTVQNVTISDFRMDGNISDDPANWVTGYDAFTGNRALVLENSNNNVVQNVRVQNTMWAGIAVYGGDQNTFINCEMNRSRGNFGDSFYMFGTNFQYINCQAYDYTRIGFVVETNAGATQLSRNGKFIGCKAKYGHDSSGALGVGVEGNFGFWFENCIYVDAENCEATDNLEGGINIVPSYIAGTEGSVEDIRYSSFILTNCNITNSRYGIVINCLNQDLLNRTRIIGGSAINVNTGIYVGTNPLFSPLTYVYVEGFDIRISVHNIATRAIMQLAGHVFVDGMEVIFDEGFDQAAWDSGADTSGYSTFGAFDTSSGSRFIAKAVRCFKEIAGVKTDIGVRTKFSSTGTLANLDLELERCNISQEGNVARNIKYINCNFLFLGSDVVRDTLTFDSCKFTGRRSTGSAAITGTVSTTKDILITNCLFLFDTADDYLYLYNQSKVSAAPLVRIKDCRFIRNFETNGYVIRFDATPDFKLANNGVFNIEISGCTFENTGGTTANPILTSGFEVVDAAKIFGYGNLKSTSITNNTSGNITTTNFTVVAF